MMGALPAYAAICVNPCHTTAASRFTHVSLSHSLRAGALAPEEGAAPASSLRCASLTASCDPCDSIERFWRTMWLMTQATDPLSLRDRLLAATYRCVERFGLGKTTIEDVVKESGVSRATIYRQFPGGRDELLLETVGWELTNYFTRLADQVRDAPDLAELLRTGLAFARRSITEHDLLRK